MLPEQQLNNALAGRYEVDREIGAGGMATVYLARDLRHNRRVALKVLKPELGAVLGVERFLAEIEVTANLQHPNLLPLFDSGEANGLLFYVMPYVEGETLRHRLEREKQLPVDEAVRIATAIAGALEHAHARGVIHRDLKPENILLQSGQPVIADFGIALAVSNAGGARITQTGLSLGTPQYMSPEQATGDRVIDGRADIYSLGAITYEMLVGDPPHLGSTAQAVIAKLLTERAPSVQASRPSVSDEVAHAVERALEKLPADRWSSAREFADALTGKAPTARTHTASGVRTARTRAESRLRLLAAGAMVAAVAGVAAAVYFASRQLPVAATGRFALGLPDSVTVFAGAGTKLALSPDGSRLVIVGTKGQSRALYMRNLDDPVAHIVPGSDTAQSPTFSADGRWIVFKTSAALKKLPVSGGTPQVVADSVLSSGSLGDGQRLVFDYDNSLWLGTSEGRDAKRIAKPDSARHIYRYRWPEVLPGGTHALVTIDRFPTANVVDSLRLAVVSLGDGTVTDLGVFGTNPHYVEPGRIVFGRAGGLVYSAPFSLRRLQVTGAAELLLQEIWQGSGGATDVAASRAGGVLAFRGGTAHAAQLVLVDRSGGARELTGEPGMFRSPRVSPDAHRVAVEIGALASPANWILDLTTHALTPLSPGSSGIKPEWTRDGSRVVFLRRFGSAGISLSWDRSDSTRVLWTKPGVMSVSLGPKGGYWAFGSSTEGGHDAIWIAPEDSLNAMRPLLKSSATQRSPRMSPNGRLVAYVSSETGRGEVYVSPVPEPGPRVSVSVGGGDEPIWSADGTTLFYRSDTRLMSATITERPQLGVARRDSLFIDNYERSSGHSANFDVLSSGREFIMVRPVRGVQRDEVNVIMNWRSTGAPSVPRDH